MAGAQRVEIRERRIGLRAVERPCEQLQPLGLELLDDLPQADLDAAHAQSANGVAEVALRLTEIVGLCEPLTCEHLVGDLAVSAARVRVVYAASLRCPLEELAATGRGRTDEPLAHPPVALRVDHDGAHAPLHRRDGYRRLRDRLARAGRPHDERVYAGTGGCDRYVDVPPELVGAKQHRVARLPVRMPGSVENQPRGYAHAGAQRLARRPAQRRCVCEVEAGGEVFAMPPAPAHGCAEGSDAGREPAARKVRANDDEKREGGGAPAPMQPASPQNLRCEPPQRQPEHEVDDGAAQRGQRVVGERCRVVKLNRVLRRGHHATPF